MPFKVPMGRLFAIEAGSKKLTIQTEFIAQAECRIETKIYLGGALKKMSALNVNTEEAQDLQQLLDDYHDARVKEISDGLRHKSPSDPRS